VKGQIFFWIISSLDEFTSLTFPTSLDLKKDIDLAEFDDIKGHIDGHALEKPFKCG
jgi:hypothetical protein